MPSPRRTFIWALSCALGVMTQPSFASELRVVASFSILADIVSEVAGEAIEIKSIVGPDADAHVYQPSVADAIAVARADVVFVNGLGFETWSSKLISESASSAVVVVATEGIRPIDVEGSVDPHAWNSLKNGTVYVRNIAAALSAIAPWSADQVNANAAAYIQRLESVDINIARRVSRLPESNRTVVTSHDAFGYLAKDYGLTFLAPQGIDSDAEPTAQKLAELIEQLKDVGAAALFAENIMNPSIIYQIAHETGLEVGGRLYSDALSARGGPAKSYLEMFIHNTDSILEALERSSQRGIATEQEIVRQPQLTMME